MVFFISVARGESSVVLIMSLKSGALQRSNERNCLALLAYDVCCHQQWLEGLRTSISTLNKRTGQNGTFIKNIHVYFVNDIP